MKYRVDRVKRGSKQVPCGMNSILYLGKSEKEARRIFRDAETGIRPFNTPDPEYGLMLSCYAGYESETILATR